MKVRDLIAALSTMPHDATVFVNGYEGGIEPALEPKEIRASEAEGAKADSYLFGTHEVDSDGLAHGVLLARAHWDNQ